VHSFLKPHDPQDVPLSYELLVAVSKLPKPSPNDSPIYSRTRQALNLLGKLYSFLLEPYTNTQYSLRDQLNSLSAGVHCILSLYIKGRSAFMPVQLYADIMHMVKNMFFCVAKTQCDDIDGKLYIILLGTDRLEVEFGNVHSMVGNNANADLLQLSLRVTTATETAAIQAARPEWDSSLRRLAIPALAKQGDDLDRGIDHINPASWVGDITVEGVNLRTCWAIGRGRAVTCLLDGNLDPRFDDLEEAGNIDILSPLGSLVQNDGLLLGEEDEEEELVRESCLIKHCNP
jgi:hypothetical protein